MRKKIISCLLALAMVFSVIQGTGVPVKADPGTEENNTVKVNVGCFDTDVTDTDVSQRIVKTFDAMINAGYTNVISDVDDETEIETNYKSYIIGIDRVPTNDLYDFSVIYDKKNKICTVACGPTANINTFETVLDCSGAEGDGVYSSITFCTYVGVVFSAVFEGIEGAYFSKGIDGSQYTSESDYAPNMNGDLPYYIPYGGTLADMLTPELYAGEMANKIESEFVCFPEVTYNGKRYYSWYLVDSDEEPAVQTKVEKGTTYTKMYNILFVSFDECAHNYPASTDTENDNVVWSWGTAENDYKDTSVTITCTDEGCTESIFIENTEDFPNSISIDRTDIATTCTTDGKTIYTATAKYVENGTTYTYTSTKTVDGAKATGHQWVFDTVDANAIWNEDNTAVTIKKTCNDESHDTTTDGVVEVTVSSSSITNEEIPATKCGETSKTVYTATFNSSIDAAIVDPFTISKTVEGDKLQHNWVIDVNPNNVDWLGSDSDGYTQATITKTCNNDNHEDLENKTVNITVNVKREVKDNETHFVATFDSKVDSDIETPISFEKIVQGEVHQHDWKYETDNPELTQDENKNYILTIKKTCDSTVHSEPVTVNVSSKNVTISTGPAIKCEGATSLTYTAKFNSEIDPDIPETGEFTVIKTVDGPILSHNWVFETDPGKVTWVGSDTIGYTAAIIDKTCKNPEHGEDNEDYCTSVKIEKTIESATKCGDASKITYTATFDTEADPLITNAFTVTKTVEGSVLQHNWEYNTANVTWNSDYTQAAITKTCKNPEHGELNKGVSVSSTKISTSVEQAITCGSTGKVHYTATFDSTVDPDISNSFSVSKDVENAVLNHNWQVKSYTSGASFENKPEQVTINLECGRNNTHKDTIVTDNITETVDIEGNQKTYTYTGTANDGQIITVKETVYSHTEHTWNVKFTWKKIPGLLEKNGKIAIKKNIKAGYLIKDNGVIKATQKALDTFLSDTVVTAEATCEKGNEKENLKVSIENKLVGNQIQYKAKVTDPNGKEWKAYKSYNIKDGTIKDGPAGTSSVEGGDIVIIGLEETYPFTGSKIKPAITVMDGDVVMAQSTDYTVSYTGKNKIGEINTVEVKGKGNYAGKSATAKFKITDPRDAVEDKDKLADKVSKVSVNNKKFTYNGKAQYPSEVTVTLKDKSTIVYKVEEDGSFSTESEKEVGLSFSNNVNKGTATVAAMGSDGKVKKASYTIAAAEIASAEFEISAVDWAVKAATPEIKATIKLGDEDVELVAGQDYKVSFKAKEAGENKGTAKISGKGNFKGKHADVTYTVNPMEITENNIVVKAIAGKKAKDVKVTVNDAFGNALNKKFYTVEIQNADGTALNKGDALTEEIKVVVKGANAAVTTGEDGVTIDVKPGGDIAKVKGAFKVDKNFFKTYTGEPITLDADDFGSTKIVVGDLKYDEDFKIVGYKNNIKKGTMTVTVQGIGESYSGTKTFKVKIKAKPLDKVAPEN